MTILSSRGHHQYTPPPQQDENGDWWFYEPEMGWHNNEHTERLFKSMFPNALVKDEAKIKGRIIICSTVGEVDNSGCSFKDLWDKK